jgi:hypothetical protein
MVHDSPKALADGFKGNAADLVFKILYRASSQEKLDQGYATTNVVTMIQKQTSVRPREG